MLKLQTIGMHRPDSFGHRTHTMRLALERCGSSDRWTSDGLGQDLDMAKADFKAAWENLKARTSKDELAAAYKALNIRDDDDDKSPDDKERSCAANLRLFRVIQELPAWP